MAASPDVEPEGIRLVGPDEYELPVSYKPGMLVPGRLFVDEALLEAALADRVIEQVANVAMLPGIVEASIAVPDVHWGYGFPIGGVAGTDVDRGGVVSPGGVGFDIACGVRLLRTDLQAGPLRPRMQELIHQIARSVPKGLGGKGGVSISPAELDGAMSGGVSWAVKAGYGRADDPPHCEDGGVLTGADPALVSKRAIERGLGQLGTLGSGNHFLEIQEVQEIFDESVADSLGLFPGQMTVMIHSGSRGLGHQVCTDFIRKMDDAALRYGIHVPDRQLACVPAESPEGRDYLAAMAAAGNFAIANRQLMTHQVRRSFEYVLRRGEAQLGLEIVYDVSHNLARIETHRAGGRDVRMCVHRKGSTRSLGPRHPLLTGPYAAVGQPVIIPGDMGTASYVLVGTEASEPKSWSSTCHGAGRRLSRGEAKRRFPVAALRQEMAERGVIVEAGHAGALAEEAPGAYKDVNEVVQVCETAGLSRRVARLRPIAVLKG